MERIEKIAFTAGELYAFARAEEHYEGALLWGIFEGRDEQGAIRLESASCDYLNFRLHDRLPGEYRFARLASRNELRDYAFNMGLSRL